MPAAGLGRGNGQRPGCEPRTQPRTQSGDESPHYRNCHPGFSRIQQTRRRDRGNTWVLTYYWAAAPRVRERQRFCGVPLPNSTHGYNFNVPIAVL